MDEFEVHPLPRAVSPALAARRPVRLSQPAGGGRNVSEPPCGHVAVSIRHHPTRNRSAGTGRGNSESFAWRENVAANLHLLSIECNSMPCKPNVAGR